MKKINIFDIVRPYDNDIIASMDTEYKKHYLKYLNQHMLEMREFLGLNNDFAFGVEIEVEQVNFEEYKKIMFNKENCDWNFVEDESLKNGKEVTSPLLNDNGMSWMKLANILMNLSNCSTISLNCGGHIHFSGHLLQGKALYYLRLLKVFAAYENIIYRFGYGEFLTERQEVYYYSEPLLNFVHNTDLVVRYKKIFLNRYRAINYNLNSSDYHKIISLKKGKTIEFRSPNGSLNPIIWQNNINFFANLIKFVMSEKYDEELVIKRLNNLYDNCKGDFLIYRQIDIDGAIELADLIFDKNIDKVYFLRQYIKNYEVGIEELEKGTKFTKNPNY